MKVKWFFRLYLKRKLGNALRAAWTALSTSSAEEFGTGKINCYFLGKNLFLWHYFGYFSRWLWGYSGQLYRWNRHKSQTRRLWNWVPTFVFPLKFLPSWFWKFSAKKMKVLIKNCDFKAKKRPAERDSSKNFTIIAQPAKFSVFISDIHLEYFHKLYQSMTSNSQP